MKIISIVGARPQFIKLSPVSKQLRVYFNEIIIHTGQHYDRELSNLFFEELNIPEPDYNLGVGSGTHGEQTAKMILAIEKVLIKELPSLVVLFGDTNSTLAGAIAASKLNIKIAHIEAGMRNFDRQKPEEINRIMTDHVSDYLFAPTKVAVNNLKKEGIVKNVFLVGDTTIDSLYNNILIAEKKSTILEKYNLKNKKYYLLTLHKQKNTDNKKRLKTIMSTISMLNIDVVFPMHPRTKKFLIKYDLMNLLNNSKVKIIKPLGYLDFICLLKNSKTIITDSGGAQKEAYILKVPCITLRETEWVETIEEGWNKLVDIDENKIIDALKHFKPKNKQKNFLGKGNASNKISKIIFDIMENDLRYI